MTMRLFFAIAFVLPIVVFAEPSEFYRNGNRQLNDRQFVTLHEKQGPFADNRTLTFNFEYQLEGRFVSALTLKGEPIYVCFIID